MKKLFIIVSEILFLYTLAWGVPFLLYVLLSLHGTDITPIIYLVIVFSLLLTACAIWLEMLIPLKSIHTHTQNVIYPPASVIIPAYLPNEAATVIDTIEAFLRVRYPGSLQVILAYNTPCNLPIEKALKEITDRDYRFLPLLVPDSISKAQNINAALAYITGTFVGIFDADHHPDPDIFIRAWKWLSQGYDVVQGHCVIRNGNHSWLTRIIAVEFEVIYALSHPGRNSLHGFGIFGGSNGFWKVDVLRQICMNSNMLTEDIDASVRTVMSGYSIANDPLLISRELAPVSFSSLWNQRMRWAQGWFQVSIKHIVNGLCSKHLSFRQKMGILYLLGWREIYPWISLQIPPLIAFWAWKYHGLNHLNWFIPIFLITTIFTQLTSPTQILFTYFLAEHRIRKHRRWFLWYAILSFVFYSGFKNVICLVAQMKEIQRKREWKVTPRHIALGVLDI